MLAVCIEVTEWRRHSVVLYVQHYVLQYKENSLVVLHVLPFHVSVTIYSWIKLL